MNILFLTQVLPYPLDAGPKTRAYYVLRHLAGRHALTLVSFVRSSDPPEAIAHLRQYCSGLHTVPLLRSRWRDALALAQSQLRCRSWIITRDDNQQMHALLRHLVSQQHFDFIHADQLWMAQYALKAGQATGCRLVLDQHNAVYRIPQRMAGTSGNPFLRAFMALESRRLREYERAACHQFDRVVWLTQQDHQAVMGTAADSSGLNQPPTIIPICVDPGEFQPVQESTSGLTGDSEILFVGGMHWPPNLEGVRWFIRQVLPRVRASIPNARFVVVGKQPPPDVRSAEGVEAAGYVGNLEPYFARGRVFVVPLLAGGGMRVKILDAWLRGLPVVSTTIGAEGIHCTDGVDIRLVDQPERFADILINLLLQPQEAQRLGAAGRGALEEHYDWRKIYSHWDEIYT